MIRITLFVLIVYSVILSLAYNNIETVVAEDFTTSNQSIYDTCNSYLHEYDKYITTFMHCALLNARPFRMCENCVDSYFKAVTIYEELEDDNGQWSRCEALLLHADMVQVIWHTNKFVTNLWTTAQCKYCYSVLKENNINGTVTAEMAADVETFLDIYNTTLSCFNASHTIKDWKLFTTRPQYTNHTSPVCRRCSKDYKALGTAFAKMTPGAICMDIVDIMNYTRLMWSKEYNCSHRWGDDSPVIAITVVLCAIPVLFYVGNRIHGERPVHRIVRQKRLKRHHTALTDSVYTSGILGGVNSGDSDMGGARAGCSTYGSTDALIS